MKSIDVVGGVYGERCAFPHWEAIYGSAGRAAAGLSEHVDTIRLHTISPLNQLERITPIFESYGVDVIGKESEVFIDFDYLHCLADPNIIPHPSVIRRQSNFHVKAQVAILFGMMECSPTVDAEICVFDPQSPNNPSGFRSCGSNAKRLAFIANAREIELLTCKKVEDGVHDIFSSEKAEVVVVKRGIKGALVFDSDGNKDEIPAYKTKRVFTIGSGDVFVTAFALAWAVNGKAPVEAANYASKAVADYVETRTLPIQSFDDAGQTQRDPVILKKSRVYLAGPFRDLGQRLIVNEARKILHNLGMSVVSPVHDFGHGPAEKVVNKDLQALKDCDVIFAVLNGSTPGTAFEIGYAAALEKPIFCVAQNVPENNIKLPVGVGCTIDEDFVSALHLLAWRR